MKLSLARRQIMIKQCVLRKMCFQATNYNLNLFNSASGKTKFLDAFAFTCSFIRTSAKLQGNEKINVQPFLLNTETEKEPSVFEVIFIHEGILYQYGFEVTEDKIISEWLFYKPKTKEIELFYRFEQDFGQIHKDFKAKKWIDRINSNMLIISKGDNENEPIAKKVFQWFMERLNVISGIAENTYLGFTLNRLENEQHKIKTLKFLEAADLGIQDVLLENIALEDLPTKIQEIIKRTNPNDNSETKVLDIRTLRNKYDENNRKIGYQTFSMKDDESSGTEKYFALSAPILDSLENGKILMIDELDAKLHPNLVEKIIQLFNSKETNPKNAQLIFNAHSTDLLSIDLFRRGHIWFVQKNRYGASKLYSLADFKTDEVRKDDSFKKNT